MEGVRIRPVARAIALLAIVTVMAACQAPYSRTAARSVTPQTITLQPGDVPGMIRCDVSGDVTTVLSQEKSRRSPAYDMNATEWAQWKQQGAVDAYFAVYGQTPADCAAASDSSTGAPPQGLMVGLVVQFRDTSGAARNFQRESTLMGLGPRDIRFVELAGGTTTIGPATGLGADSVVGSATVAGAHYFVALWQNHRFESDFIGYNMPADDADHAVLAMNGRILQG